MNKKAIISIEGYQSTPEGDETLSLTTEGEYCSDVDGIYVHYHESELTGLEGTSTVLTITPRNVTISRTGNAPVHLVFEPGKKHRSLYQIPEGIFELGISTHRMDYDFTSSGGFLEMEYATEFEHMVTGENLFRIEVKEAQPNAQSH